MNLWWSSAEYTTYSAMGFSGLSFGLASPLTTPLTATGGASGEAWKVRSTISASFSCGPSSADIAGGAGGCALPLAT